MNFKEYIESHRPSVYSLITQYLKIKEPEAHYKMAREYSDRQGSYRRPSLVMLTGQMFGAEIEDLLLPAAAMQISEDWILIHDDIEDDSELRRGKPALQKIYGNELAINAGDAVHIVMWKMLKDHIANVGLRKGAPIFDKFYSMLEYTVEGQYIEDNFIFNVRSLARANEDLYFRIVDSKTCYYTVFGPMQIGAMVAGKKGRILDVLKDVGHPAGVAFQITDDILDMTGDEAVFGKKRYGDLYEGKLTLIILHAYKSATADERSRMDRIYSKRRNEKTTEDIDYLVSTVEKYKGLEYAHRMAQEYVARAKSAAERHRGKFPENEYRDILLSAIEELYARKK